MLVLLILQEEVGHKRGNMDLGIIIAIVGSTSAIIGVTVALILWARGEANADRRDIVNLIIAIKEDASNFRKEMAQESRDFHARLCVIEENRGRK